MTQKRLKELIFGVGVFMATSLCFALPGQAAQQDPLQQLYQAAKAEGKVVYWGPADPEELGPIVKAFKKKFPGIEVEHFEIRSDDFAPRAIAEAGQRRISYDIGEGRMSTLRPLLERDLIQSYKDWRSLFKDLRAKSIWEDGRLLTWYNLVYPLAYNTKLLKPEDVPQSWEDLLDPKWKGKILVEVRANTFGYVGIKWGKEKIVNYVKKLRDQKPIFVKGGTTVVQQLNAGVAPLAVGTYLHKIIQNQKEGNPVDWARKISPLGATNTCNFIMKGAPHPNAAKLLVGYMASDEGIKVQAEAVFKGPMYPGSPVPGVAELAQNKVEMIWEDSDNYKMASDMNKVVAETLGILK